MGVPVELAVAQQGGAGTFGAPVHGGSHARSPTPDFHLPRSRSLRVRSLRSNVREAPESGEGRRHFRFAGSRRRSVRARGARPASKRARRSRDFPPRDGLEGVRHRQLVGGARASGTSRSGSSRRTRAQPLRFTGTGTPFGGQTNTFSVDTLVRPSLQAAVGFLSLPHLGAELGIIVPMGIVAGPQHAERRRRPPHRQGVDVRQPGPRRHPDPSQAALPERDPPRPRLRGHAVGHPRHGRQELVPRRGADDLPADGDPRHRARLPRPLPRRGQRRHAHPRRRRRPTSNNAGSFTTPPTYSGAGHHHRRLDRGQERGHRRPRPVVRHRAAEVRPGRRALRQLRPRLAPDRTPPARRARR